MDKTGKIILVIGATGTQGGSAIKQLLSERWAVRALVREPEKPAAQELQSKGVELVKGDMEDRSSLVKAMEGVYGVFSIQQFWGLGAEGEVRQGRNTADAAKTAGVQHIVYSSVGGAERQSGLSHFESKWQIEQHIKRLELPATILRPVFFMDNLKTNSAPKEIDGVLTFLAPMKPSTKLQMIASDDIGVFAAIAFNHPEEYIGKAIELAGDDLSYTELADIMTRKLGKTVRFVPQPMEQVRSYSEEVADMFEWFEHHGYKADIAALRKIHPQLQKFDTWVQREQLVTETA